VSNAVLKSLQLAGIIRRVIGQALQRVAQSCKYRISKRLSLLRLVLLCTVLRSRWYQSGIDIALSSASFCDSSPVLVNVHGASGRRELFRKIVHLFGPLSRCREPLCRLSPTRVRRRMLVRSRSRTPYRRWRYAP
jgi:hypothetical protein